MEASLDLKLDKSKKSLILKSVSAAFFLFFFFTVIMAFILVKVRGYPIMISVLNASPLGIISTAVAISSSSNLNDGQKEFIIYESSISDIIGILVFDFFLLNQDSIGLGLLQFAIGGLMTVVIAIAVTSGLGYLLHKTKYHVNYVIIMTSVVMVYVLAKLANLPALFLVLVFGLALSNNRLVEHTIVNRFVDFEKFRSDIDSFRKIMGELTFLVRSFFFIMFGFYTKIDGLINSDNLVAAGLITAGIYLLRTFFFTMTLKMQDIALILFAPRGLITILLFLSIPSEYRISVINEEVITLVILFTLAFMMAGNFFSAKKIKQKNGC
jgi:potassium/hydrogen antiporter